MQFSRVAKDLAICLNSPIISSISSCDIIGFMSLRSMKISIQTILRAPLCITGRRIGSVCIDPLQAHRILILLLRAIG